MKIVLNFRVSWPHFKIWSVGLTTILEPEKPVRQIPEENSPTFKVFVKTNSLSWSHWYFGGNILFFVLRCCYCCFGLVFQDICVSLAVLQLWGPDRLALNSETHPPLASLPSPFSFRHQLFHYCIAYRLGLISGDKHFSISVRFIFFSIYLLCEKKRAEIKVHSPFNHIFCFELEIVNAVRYPPEHDNWNLLLKTPHSWVRT